MENPLVSLIIMSYNYGRFIGQTIQSVLDQTYPNWELIIVDDGSTDNSSEIIRSYEDRRITSIINETNQGACKTYNQAYTCCTGKYVGSVDADDWFAPEKLARQVAYLETHPETDIVGTFIHQVDAAGRELYGSSAIWVNEERDLNLLDNWAIKNCLCHSSVLIRKERHDLVGGLDPDLPLTPDFDLWLRCLLNKYNFFVIPESLTYYRTHSSNVSSNHKQSDLFSELAYLYCKYLAGYILASDRADLTLKIYKYFHQTFFWDVPVALLHRLFHKLANFMLYPVDFPSFKEAFNADWQLAPKKLVLPPKTLEGSLSQEPAPVLGLRRELVIIDDYFPNILTGFRVFEFNYYLTNLDCTIYSSNPNFDALKEEYLSFYPQYSDKIQKFEAGKVLNCKLLYIVFLTNTFSILPIIEREEIPFVFTLYPGAGFLLYNSRSDYHLLQVTNSKFFKKMIVTQKVTYDYLLKYKLCPPEKIEFIYGGVFPSDYYSELAIPHRYYNQDKSTFDICFVAMKYMSEGRDKGYDVFIEVAKALARLSPAFRFHVVGGFGPEDIDVAGLRDRITFYGLQPTQFFTAFYAGMDIIISPNVPFMLASGAFDGFPLGCCIEAALCGVAVFCTDLLGENEVFTPGLDICIIPREVDGIVAKIIPFLNDPAALYRLAMAGQQRFREVFSTKPQLVPRLKLLKDYL